MFRGSEDVLGHFKVIRGPESVRDPVSIPQTSLLHHLFVDTQLQEVVKIVEECWCMVEYSPGWHEIDPCQLTTREGRKEMFYLTMYSTHMIKDYSDSEGGNTLLPLHGLLFSICSQSSFICTIREGRMYSTHFIYIIWWRITQTGKKEARSHHFIGYSFWLAARDLLYAPSYIPQPLLHQLWNTGLKKYRLNGSTMKGRSDDLLHYE